MSENGDTWEKLKKELLSNPDSNQVYKELESEYEVIRQIIKARIEQDMTQSELARLIGTKQSDISRLESGDCNPTLRFIKKVARGLGKELHISFE